MNVTDSKNFTLLRYTAANSFKFKVQTHVFALAPAPAPASASASAPASASTSTSVSDLAGVVSYAPRVMLQIAASLTNNFSGVIYNHNIM